MNPKNQDCLSQFGYGTGFFQRETRIAAQVGLKSSGFCNHCPKRSECWNLHKDKAAEEMPERVADFWELLKHYGYPLNPHAGRIAVEHMVKEDGHPDPYTIVTMNNIARGMNDREGEIKSN